MLTSRHGGDAAVPRRCRGGAAAVQRRSNGQESHLSLEGDVLRARVVALVQQSRAHLITPQELGDHDLEV